MKILAIDTSTKNASAAIQNNDKIISKNICNEVTHSEKLLPLIDECLVESNISIKAIDLFACSNGPGSFTGIRIGLSTIKALAHVNNKNIIAISSLLVLAFSLYKRVELKDKLENGKKVNICSLIDAKNDRVYYCVYSFSNINGKLHIEKLCNISNDYIDEAMQNILNLKLDSIYFCGDYITKFIDKINSSYKLNKNVYEINLKLDSKYIIDYINEVDSLDDDTYSYLNLDAIYARASQAERMKQNGN